MISIDLMLPQMVTPALLTAVALIAIYFHFNRDKFKYQPTKMKEVLIKQALEDDPFWNKYKLAMDTHYKLGKLGLTLDYRKFLLINLAIACLLMLVSILVMKNMPLMFIAPIIWLLFVHQLIDNLYRKKVKAKIDRQVELFLQLLAEIYGVSDNLPQAIERVVPSTPQPLKGELEMLLLKIKTNEDLHDCLIEFASKIDNSDIKTFVHGIVLANQFGADLKEVITKNAQVIRERLALKEELINEVRGKKVILLIFMAVLPVTFLWLFIGSPDAREVFTGTAKGQYILSILVLTEYLCWYFDSRKGVMEEI